MREPEFFIVGAPRCGTTAMYEHLRKFPAIYMPAEKEVHHFATDLIGPDDRFRPKDEYMRLFKNARDDQVVGEASVFYLYSREAPVAIHQFNPDARIIIQLRHPVQWMQSYHARLVLNADEDLTDIAEALAAETDRRAGLRIPPALRFVERLFYSEIGLFGDQVARYYDVFDPEQIHVVIFDDLIADPLKVVRGVLSFLGVEADDIPFERANKRRSPRNAAVSRLLYHPPKWLRGLGKRLTPGAFYRWVQARLMDLNAGPHKSVELDEALAEKLAEQFRPQVEALERILDRDLDSWKTAPKPKAAPKQTTEPND